MCYFWSNWLDVIVCKWTSMQMQTKQASSVWLSTMPAPYLSFTVLLWRVILLTSSPCQLQSNSALLILCRPHWPCCFLKHMALLLNSLPLSINLTDRSMFIFRIMLCMNQIGQALYRILKYQNEPFFLNV